MSFPVYWGMLHFLGGLSRDDNDAVVDCESLIETSGVAGGARFHHGEKRVTELVGGDVLRFAMSLDRHDEPQVARRASGDIGRLGRRGLGENAENS